MRTVAEILEKKGPPFNYIDANATVLEAITLMKSENISYLIIRENGKYIGLVSERDYAHKIILLNRQSNKTKVKEIVTTDLPTISGTDTPEYCMQLMNGYKTRYLPVFEDFEFKGVITIHDLMRESIAQHEDDIKNKYGGEENSLTSRSYWI